MLLSPPNASLALQAGFVVLPCAVAVLVAMLIGRARGALGHAPEAIRKTVIVAAISAAAWMGFWLLLAAAGLFARPETKPPPLAIALVAIVATSIVIVRSRVGEWLATGLSTTAIIGLQAFRLPLEMMMHRAATEGVMPVQMSFSGWNFDILTGVLALVIFGVFRGREVPRWIAILFATIGTGLLFAIVTISVVSTPQFHVFGDAPGQVNTWIFFPPFILLPMMLVATALLFQLVLFRHLMMRTGKTT